MKISLLLCLLALGAPATAEPPSTPLPWWTQRPCPTEDAVNCAWDAGAAGNGAGHSFVVRELPDGTVCVMYVERRYARHHDRCHAG
jgi:hypothetical protein